MSEDSANEPSQSKSQNQQQRNQLQHQQQQFSAMSGMTKQTLNLQSQLQHALPQQNFFADYQPPQDGYDEILDSSGKLRAHWSQLNQGLGQIGAAGIEHRWKQIRRMVHQNGIAYSAYGDPGVREKHLQLDPLPQLIPASEWNRIDAALKQRAELLNLMLADLYGPRTLLTQGILPADILFHHPHYQLPYHELPAPGGKHLHFYAAEMIRAPSGEWWVMSDRSDSPGGCGFALENRIVVSRAFPNEFRRGNVRRLAPYFIAMRNHLASLATRNRENPHIAILSAGAGNASYFEDSFLARYLGFSLVETNDLVVRSGSVMLKTLGGLAPIDVIMRRQQGNHLDPLELGGGAPGIAGILQVIRDGNVAIANSPGSGLVESPIFMAFLPRVCRALMQTDLMLPGVATWWGGEPESLELMLDRIDEVNLIPAFRQRTGSGLALKSPSPTGSELDSIHPKLASAILVHPKLLKPETMSRDERIALLQHNPAAWVGQEKIARSSAAIWENGALHSGFVTMRTFLTASGDSWHSLPGGLTRVSGSPDEPIRNPFEGCGAKDAWVLAEEPVVATSLLRTFGDLIAPSRSNGFLPSRVADNLCWLGRYLERADAAARLLRAVLIRLTSEIDPADSIELPALIRALALSGQIDAGYAIKEFSKKLPPLDVCLPISTLDHSDAQSLRSQVDKVVLLASRVRDRMSSDAWRIVQEMSSNFGSSEPTNCDLADLLDITNTLIVDLAAFSGLVSESMTRTHAFRFLNIGRRLEHSLQITSLIKHCFTQQEYISNELLEAVLDVADSGMTYRSRYYANLQMPAVLDLLLVDEMNPRSLAFQLLKLNINLESLPGNSGNSQFSTDRKLAMDALHLIRMVNLLKLCETNGQGERRTLLELLEKIESHLPAISTSISNRFLVHSGPVHQMISDEFRPN